MAASGASMQSRKPESAATAQLRKRRESERSRNVTPGARKVGHSPTSAPPTRCACAAMRWALLLVDAHARLLVAFLVDVRAVVVGLAVVARTSRRLARADVLLVVA